MSSKQRQESDNNDLEFGNNNNNNGNNYFITRLTSCDVQRSPTLPAEIRLRGNNVKTAEICLEEAAEKRRKLIEALEKCDEDLKELKKIIDVVKSSSVSVTVAVDREDNDNNNKINGDLQPSPVSVLDDFTPLSSALSSSSYPRRYTNGEFQTFTTILFVLLENLLIFFVFSFVLYIACMKMKVRRFFFFFF